MQYWDGVPSLRKAILLLVLWFQMPLIMLQFVPGIVSSATWAILNDFYSKEDLSTLMPGNSPQYVLPFWAGTGIAICWQLWYWGWVLSFGIIHHNRKKVRTYRHDNQQHLMLAWLTDAMVCVGGTSSFN